MHNCERGNGPSLSFHNKSYSDSDSVGNDWLRMDQVLSLPYEGKFCTQLTAPNLL